VAGSGEDVAGAGCRRNRSGREAVACKA
jgi:hypothetical protein